MLKHKKSTWTTTTSGNPISVASATLASGALTSTTIHTTGYSQTITKTKYYVLDREIEVDGYRDFNVGLCISLINQLGIEYYLELSRQEISFPNEISDYLEEEVLRHFRDKKINKIIE
jgi:hypothetical protein